jgi:hypothetical protein
MMSYLIGGKQHMKLKFIFGPNGDIDTFSTNILHTSYDEVLSNFNNPNNNVISYTLNDLPLTRKLINLWPSYINEQRKILGNKIIYNYNYYISSLTNDLLSDARNEMNNTIMELRTFGFNIPDNLILSLDGDHNEFNKINELHFLFESSYLKRTSNEPRESRTIYLWEKVNNLVHFIEKELTSDTDASFDFVNRINLSNGTMKPYYVLQDEDYVDFRAVFGGELVADFSTVGKDMHACSTSNDMELIRKNEVKQQTLLTDFFCLVFNNKVYEEKGIGNWKSEFYNWCETNRVDQYIDYRLPKYSPGRHVLGQIDQPIYTAEDFYDKIFNKTPNFLGCGMFDDNNQIIL